MPGGLSIDNPIPFGQFQITTEGFSVWVLDVVEDATEMVLQANEYVDPPPEGHQFVLVRLKVKNNTATPMNFSTYPLNAVGESSVAFDGDCGHAWDLVGELDPFEGSREMFEGGELEGNVCFTVKSSDVDENLLLFYDRQPRLFWSLSETTSGSEPIALRAPVAIAAANPTPTVVGENRNSPIPFGQSTITDDGFSVWVLEVVENANEMIFAEHTHTRYGDPEPPPEGYQYVLARIKVKNNIAEPKNFYAEGRLSAVGKSNVEFGHGCGHTPDEFNGGREMFETGELEGNVCFTVKSSDVGDSLAMYDKDATRLFWSLSKTTATSETVPTRYSAAIATVRPTPTAIGENRNNPIPLGKSQVTRDGFSLWVVDVIEDATQMVLAASTFQRPPREGHQFFIAKIKVKNNTSESKNFYSVHRLNAVGMSSVEYEQFDTDCYYNSVPDEFDDSREIFEGGELEGNLCFTVKHSDVGNLVLFDKEDRRKLLFWAMQ